MLRDALAAAFGRPVRGRTGTDADSQHALTAALAGAGFTGVDETVVEYLEERTVEELIGSVYSAMSPPHGPAAYSGGFEADLDDALADVAVDGRLSGRVQVKIASAPNA